MIITSSPKTWKIGAELIKLYQRTEFSHVAIIKDNLVFQASHGYVNCCHIDIFLQENNIVYVHEIEPSLIDMDFVYRQLGKKYSIIQVFAVPILRLVKATWSGNGDEKFICSEFVGKALKLDWVGELTTPKEIDNYLRSIWQN